MADCNKFSKQKGDKPEIVPHDMGSHTDAVYQISSGCNL